MRGAFMRMGAYTDTKLKNARRRIRTLNKRNKDFKKFTMWGVIGAVAYFFLKPKNDNK